MPQKSNETKGVSTATDKHLCEFLLSPFKSIGIKIYKSKFSPKLSFPESSQQITNRVKYLKKLQANNPDRFASICCNYGIGTASPPAVTDTSFDSDTSSGSESEGEDESDSGDEEEIKETVYPPPKAPATTPPKLPKMPRMNIPSQFRAQHDHCINIEDPELNIDGMLWFFGITS
jgi:hypothetical protein